VRKELSFGCCSCLLPLYDSAPVSFVFLFFFAIKCSCASFPSRRFFGSTILLRQRHQLLHREISTRQQKNVYPFTCNWRLTLLKIGCLSVYQILHICKSTCTDLRLHMILIRARIYIYLIIHIYTRRARTLSSPFSFLPLRIG